MISFHLESNGFVGDKMFTTQQWDEPSENSKFLKKKSKNPKCPKSEIPTFQDSFFSFEIPELRIPNVNVSKNTNCEIPRKQILQFQNSKIQLRYIVVFFQNFLIVCTICLILLKINSRWMCVWFSYVLIFAISMLVVLNIRSRDICAILDFLNLVICMLILLRFRSISVRY